MNENWPGTHQRWLPSQALEKEEQASYHRGLVQEECMRVMCACMYTCSSSLSQIELLINRPTPTWQSLSFSTTVLTISQILLIWQNPKIKQSLTIFRSACLWSPVPGLSNGFRMFGRDPPSLPIHLPPSTCASPESHSLPATPFLWSSVCRAGTQSS
jgi:hypothetical protein